MASQETGDIFDILDLPRQRFARLILRPMLPVKGVKRTLIMGIVEGDLCPDNVDRRVDADVVITILAAERAKRRTTKKTRSGQSTSKNRYVTDDISHASLMLMEVNSDPNLWEVEEGFSRPASAQNPKTRQKKKKAQTT